MGRSHDGSHIFHIHARGCLILMQSCQLLHAEAPKRIKRLGKCSDFRHYIKWNFKFTFQSALHTAAAFNLRRWNRRDAASLVFFAFLSVFEYPDVHRFHRIAGNIPDMYSFIYTIRLRTRSFWSFGPPQKWNNLSESKRCYQINWIRDSFPLYK